MRLTCPLYGGLSLTPFYLPLVLVLLGAAQPPVFRNDPVPAALIDRIRHTTWHTGCPVAPEELRQLTLTYNDFNNMPRTGTLLVNRAVADEVLRLFRDLYLSGFQIE